jgi:hypothetical protein
VGSLELGYLTFRFVAGNSVAFLNFSDELVAPSFEHFQSSSVNRPHFSFALPINCFQFPLIWSLFIFELLSS